MRAPNLASQSAGGSGITWNIDGIPKPDGAVPSASLSPKGSRTRTRRRLHRGHQEACENELRMRRTLVERLVLQGLSRRLASLAIVHDVLARVEHEVAKLSAHVPASIQLKEAELTAEERRLANVVDFTARGPREPDIGPNAAPGRPERREPQSGTRGPPRQPRQGQSLRRVLSAKG